MMAHLPLRGMVRNKVLELFANSYRAGGAPLDLEAAAADGAGAARPLLERVAAWYVAWAVVRWHPLHQPVCATGTPSSRRISSNTSA